MFNLVVIKKKWLFNDNQLSVIAYQAELTDLSALSVSVQLTEERRG